MHKLPALKALRNFEAVARHLSFTEAARELSVTVTAVSQQVRQLESSIGHKLFERSGNRIELTTVGAAIYPELHAGLDRIARVFSTIAAPRTGDTVKMTTTRAFAERWLVPRLDRFYDAHPDIVVHIEAFEDGVELQTSDIDLAIRYGPADHSNADTTLFTDRYIAVARVISETSGPALTIDAFTARPLLAFKWKNKTLDAPTWHRWLRAAGYPHDFDFHVSWYSEETLAFHVAEQGLGALLCGDTLIADAIDAGRMQRIDGPALPGFTYRLILPAEGERTRAANRFTAWLREEAARFRPRD